MESKRERDKLHCYSTACTLPSVGLQCDFTVSTPVCEKDSWNNPITVLLKKQQATHMGADKNVCSKLSPLQGNSIQIYCIISQHFNVNYSHFFKLESGETESSKI